MAAEGELAFQNNIKTIEWIHTLSANEKTNGVQVKILAEAESNDANNDSAITNKQTMVEVI